MLDGHIAVVDEEPPAVRFGVAQVVNNRGQRRVGQRRLFQQWRGFRGEKPSVVGRQPDGCVAFVDKPEQRNQVTVVAAGVGGEGIPIGGPPRDVVAHSISHTVVVVTRVVDRQQSSIFGVEQEEQPVEEDQRRLPYRWQTLSGGVR